MNVIVANEQENLLANLDLDIIKNITGTFEALEIVEMFKGFFYSKMILDVTAIKNYEDVRTFEVLRSGLDPEKIIFLLPEGSVLCTPNFLAKLISYGIYNFTTNIEGVKYLVKKTNTLKDVESILKMAEEKEDNNSSTNNTNTSDSFNIVSSSIKVLDHCTIIGFKNVTEHAGATTFIYLVRKELALQYGNENVVAVEIDKNDFQLFRDKMMFSIRQAELQGFIKQHDKAKFLLVDLNGCNDDSFCSDVIYLLEPSTIKLNKLVTRNKTIFQKLASKKVVLNNSLLLNHDVTDFEREAGIKVFYNMPPLDERKRNAIVHDFLTKLGLFSHDDKNGSNKIFGLFRR